MKIVLVQMPCWGIKSPPFALACLSAYLKERGVEVYKHDLNIEIYTRFKGTEHEKLWSLNEWFWGYWDNVQKFGDAHRGLLEPCINEILASEARVIGFSILWSTEMMSRFLAQEIKKRDPSRMIVFGGPQCAREMAGKRIIELPEIDFVVYGEGEETLYELVKAIDNAADVGAVKGLLYKKDGSVIDTGERELLRDLNALPFADYSDFNFSLYPDPMIPASTSRGCPNRCVYCDEKKFWHIFRSYSGKRIFDEVRYQYRRHKIAKFEFVDSLANGNVAALEEFCDLVIASGLKIGWMCQAVVRNEMTSGLLRKIKDSGCFHFCFGMEHSTEAIMLKMGKLLCKGADCDAIVKHCYEAGLGTGLNWMFGFPGETREDFQADLDFFTRNQFYIKSVVSVNNATGFCGFTSACYAYEHPDEFGIILGPDAVTWRTKDGKNTYVRRLFKYQKFCRHLDKLGIRYSFPAYVNEKELSANYYFLMKNYLLAARYLEISITKEGATIDKAVKLVDLYNIMNKPERAKKFYFEFIEDNRLDDNARKMLESKISG